MDLGPAAVIRLKSPLTHDKSPSYFGEAVRSWITLNRKLSALLKPLLAAEKVSAGTNEWPMDRRINVTWSNRLRSNSPTAGGAPLVQIGRASCRERARSS